MPNISSRGLPHTARSLNGGHFSQPIDELYQIAEMLGTASREAGTTMGLASIKARVRTVTMPFPEPGGGMLRRKFLGVMGGAVATWPLAAGAQQAAIPVIGFIHGGSALAYVPFINAFRQGLRQTGFVEGSNVNIEFRWAENRRERLSAYVSELVNLATAKIQGITMPTPILLRADEVIE
jgi:hypothetical protein